MAQGKGSQKRVSKRTPHDQRRTQNVTAPALRPQATPIDSVVQPAPQGEGGGGLDLAEALGVAGQGVQEAMPYLEKYAQTQYEKGEKDAMLGKDSPESDIYWRAKAFEKTKGENQAREGYQNAVNKYLVNNKDKDPQEFQEGLEKLSKSFIEGRTENFVKGFAGVARQVEQKALGKYNQIVLKQQKRKEQQEMRSFMRNETTEAIDGLIDAEFEDISSLEELLEKDIMNYNTFFKQESNSEKLNNRLHEVLKVAQERGEAMGWTKQEVSDMFMNRIMSTAVDEGVPEILDVLYMEDEDGIALVDTKKVDNIKQTKNTVESNIEKRVQKAKTIAEKERARKREEKQKQWEKRNEARKDNIYKNSYNTLTNLEMLAIDNPKKAREKAKKLRKEKGNLWTNLDKSDYETLTDMTQGILELSVKNQNAKEDHPEVVAQFKSMMIQNDIPDQEEIRSEWKEGNITDKTYEDLLTMRAETAQSKQEDRNDKLNNARGRQLNSTIRNVTNFVVDKVEQGVFENPELASAIKENLQTELLAYRMNNDMQYPDYNTFIEEMVNPAIEAQGYTYGDIIAESTKNKERADTAQEGAEVVDNIKEIGENDGFQKAGALKGKWKDGETEIPWYSTKDNYEQQYKQVADEILGEMGIGSESDIKFFSENPPEEVFGSIDKLMNEEDIPMNTIFKKIDEQVNNSEIPLTQTSADAIKAGVVANEIVEPLFNEKVVNAEEAIPNLRSLQQDLRSRMADYGLREQGLQSMSIAYFTRLWKKATGSSK